MFRTRDGNTATCVVVPEGQGRVCASRPQGAGVRRAQRDGETGRDVVTLRRCAARAVAAAASRRWPSLRSTRASHSLRRARLGCRRSKLRQKASARSSVCAASSNSAERQGRAPAPARRRPASASRGAARWPTAPAPPPASPVTPPPGRARARLARARPGSRIRFQRRDGIVGDAVQCPLLCLEGLDRPAGEPVHRPGVACRRRGWGAAPRALRPAPPPRPAPPRCGPPGRGRPSASAGR